jgi:hypothetical protein
MLLRSLSAIAVFIASVVQSAALYAVVAHHPNANAGYMFITVIAVFLDALSFAGVYFILHPRR